MKRLLTSKNLIILIIIFLIITLSGFFIKDYFDNKAYDERAKEYYNLYEEIVLSYDLDNIKGSILDKDNIKKVDEMSVLVDQMTKMHKTKRREEDFLFEVIYTFEEISIWMEIAEDWDTVDRFKKFTVLKRIADAQAQLNNEMPPLISIPES